MFHLLPCDIHIKQLEMGEYLEAHGMCVVLESKCLSFQRQPTRPGEATGKLNTPALHGEGGGMSHLPFPKPWSSWVLGQEELSRLGWGAGTTGVHGTSQNPHSLASRPGPQQKENLCSSLPDFSNTAELHLVLFNPILPHPPAFTASGLAASSFQFKLHENQDSSHPTLGPPPHSNKKWLLQNFIWIWLMVRFHFQGDHNGMAGTCPSPSHSPRAVTRWENLQVEPNLPKGSEEASWDIIAGAVKAQMQYQLGLDVVQGSMSHLFP